MSEFQEFPKITRFYEQDVVVSEKIDGTNGLIWIGEIKRMSIQTGHMIPEIGMKVGSRSRWIDKKDDNYGFAKWAQENEEDLMKLGPGYHYGEWWGQGIQRKYGMKQKVFSLFNSFRWKDSAVRPQCCDVVPVLYSGPVTPGMISTFSTPYGASAAARKYGVEFLNPEGYMMYFTKSGTYFKAPFKNRREEK